MIKIYAIAIVVTIAGFAFVKYNKTLEELAAAEEQISNMEATMLETERKLKESAQRLKDDLEASRKAKEAVERDYLTEKKRTSELRKLLDEHDLQYLMAKKPALISNRINRATVRLFNEYEGVTESFYSKAGEGADPTGKAVSD